MPDATESVNILMILGVILFGMLAVAFAVMVNRKQSVAVLLPFFLLPIIMIGFSRVSGVKTPGIEVTIQQDTEEVRKNPRDEGARRNLSASLEKAETEFRAKRLSVDAARSIAAGHLALGQEKEAQEWDRVAGLKNPTPPKAVTPAEPVKETPGDPKKGLKS